MYETSPMTQCMIGVWYAKKFKVPLYLYVQDLWPENVEIITGIHSKLILGPIQHMVDKIYRNCTEIFVTSPDFENAVCKRGIGNEKVHYWPQYAEEFYQPYQKENIKEIPENNKFKVVFTGNIGYAQGLDILPKTAFELRKRGYDQILFVIVGDGRYRESFEKEIAPVRDMFLMIPRQPAERIPKIMAACDVAFLSFQDNELWKMTIPAKLQSYMACGMPVIASAEGETERVIKEAQCGICTPLGDSAKLAEAIIKLKEENLNILKIKSREYFMSHFEKQMLMNEIDRYFRR